jgi:hypothetical protein
MSALKQARISAKLSIEEVSSQLNIRKHYIVALEENRPEDLPPGVYAQGYIKMYSKFLGIEYMNPEIVNNNLDRNDTYRNAIEFGTKNNLGMLTAIIFVVVLAVWIYTVALPSVDNNGLVQNLENIEPANYMLNIEEPKNNAADTIKVDFKSLNMEEISDGFNESNN